MDFQFNRLCMSALLKINLFFRNFKTGFFKVIFLSPFLNKWRISHSRKTTVCWQSQRTISFHFYWNQQLIWLDLTIHLKLQSVLQYIHFSISFWRTFLFHFMFEVAPSLCNAQFSSFSNISASISNSFFRNASCKLINCCFKLGDCFALCFINSFLCMWPKPEI